MKSEILAVVGILLLAVQEWLYLELSAFPRCWGWSPNLLGVLALASLLFFLPSVGRAICPSGPALQNATVLGLMTLLLSWTGGLYFLEVGSLADACRVGAFLGGPTWLYALLSILFWQDSPRSRGGPIGFADSAVTFSGDPLFRGWVLVAAAIGQFLIFASAITMRDLSSSWSATGLIVVGLFFASSVTVMLDSPSPGLRSVWRTLTWTAGLVTMAALLASDPTLEPTAEKLFDHVTDAFAFLTPVWVVRVIGGDAGRAKR